MKLAIIVDSTTALTPPLSNHPNIYQVNLSINFPDGTIMKDSIQSDINQEFYHRLETTDSLPTTSQPPIGTYYELIDQIISQGYDSILALHLSGEISGTYHTAQMVLKEYKSKLKYHVIDSKSASVAIEGMVKQALILVDQGISFEDLGEQMEELVKETKVYFMIQDLDNLTKGGRLTGAEALVGNLLKIRPVLTFNPEGQMVVYDKFRTNKKVYGKFLELAQQAPLDFPQGFDLAIVHTENLAEAQGLKTIFLEDLNQEADLTLKSLSPVLGTHTGKGLVGFGILPHIN